MPSAVSSVLACWKYLNLASPLKGTQCGLVVPVGEEDAAIRCGQLILFPLREVLIVIQPLIHQLAEIDLHMPPEPAVDGLHLGGL